MSVTEQCLFDVTLDMMIKAVRRNVLRPCAASLRCVCVCVRVVLR